MEPPVPMACSAIRWYGARKDCALRIATATGEWSVCAPEGSNCAFTGTQEVRYGANGSYFYKTLTNGTACTNAVFGDPAYGIRKDCALRTTSDWTFCASEGGFCAFSGTKQVRYGANGSYFYKTLSGGTACTTACSVIRLRRTEAVRSEGRRPHPPPPPPPPPDPTYGPRATITCPSGAADIWPGSVIPHSRQPPFGQDHVLSASRCASADQLDHARRPAIPSSASTARSSTAPAGRRATTRRPRSGRTTRTSTT